MSCSAEHMLVIDETPLADNSCVACPTTSCSEGQNTLVYAKGHNLTNACSLTTADGSGVQFFACYPQDGSNKVPAFITKGHRLSFEALAGANKVTVDACAAGWLPPNAEWVDPGTEYPLGCVFACQYGWDTVLARQLHADIQKVVTSTRSDLLGFWSSLMNQQPKTTAYIAKQRVLWFDKDTTLNTIPGQWDQIRMVNVVVSSQSVAYAQQNTFLYLEEAVPPSNLCLAPEALVTTPCPLGYFLPSPTVRTSCALLARTQGVYEVTFPGDAAHYAIVLDAEGAIQCHVPIANLGSHFWSSYGQCKACLDQDTGPPPLQQKWRLVSSWNQDLYAFRTAGSCTDMSCSGPSIAFEKACIPCTAPDDDWSTICTPAVFDYTQCKPGKSLADVCVSCPGAHASKGPLLDKTQIQEWGTYRGSWPHFACMYICDSNYTSNPDAAAYAATPCVPCEDVVQAFATRGLCATTGALYFNLDEAQYACTNVQKRYLPYTPECTQCTLQRQIPGLSLVAPQPMAPRLSACLVVCAPALYFTVLWNGSKVFLPVEQEQVSTCEPCGEEHLVGCANLTLCIAGYFWYVCSSSSALMMPCDVVCGGFTGMGQPVSGAI